jgi:hypothetical protein
MAKRLRLSGAKQKASPMAAVVQEDNSTPRQNYWRSLTAFYSDLGPNPWASSYVEPWLYRACIRANGRPLTVRMTRMLILDGGVAFQRIVGGFTMVMC